LGAKLKAEHGPENVYDFSLGNPMLDPPASFYQALAKAAEDHTLGAHGYMPNAGYPDVRAKVAEYLTRLHGPTFSADHIIMTVGAAGALNALLKAILDPGAEVLVPSPYFVEYDVYVDNHGGKLVRVPSRPDFDLDLEALAGALNEKTYAVLINSPNNPTGVIYSEETLKELSRILSQAGERRGRPIYLISDEPYRKIVFDGAQVPSLFSIYPHSVVVTSFSKDLSLAGERIGYMAINPQAADVEMLIGAAIVANRILGSVNAPALMQKVVAQCLDDSADMGFYAKNRDLICEVLSKAGYEFTKPDGAFYVFPKSPTKDDVQFCKDAIEQNLLLVPGSGFFGPGHFRIAFCCPPEVIERSAQAFTKARERY
jgi:aspartate aminotransferase